MFQIKDLRATIVSTEIKTISFSPNVIVKYENPAERFVIISNAPPLSRQSWQLTKQATWGVPRKKLLPACDPNSYPAEVEVPIKALEHALGNLITLCELKDTVFQVDTEVVDALGKYFSQIVSQQRDNTP